jgi:hypothetical protein
MSRKLLAFLLSELQNVRVVCQGKKDGKPCGAVIEVPLASLQGVYAATGGMCHICRTPFGYFSGVGTGQDPFTPLATAILNLRQIKSNVEIEFILPDEG